MSSSRAIASGALASWFCAMVTVLAACVASAEAAYMPVPWVFTDPKHDPFNPLQYIANNTLSAKVLKLAEESNGASTSDMERKKADAERKRLAEELNKLEAEKARLEAELEKSITALEKAQEDVEAMRMSQQTQQMALLEELNSVQTENTNLRAQLRKK